MLVVYGNDTGLPTPTPPAVEDGDTFEVFGKKGSSTYMYWSADRYGDGESPGPNDIVFSDRDDPGAIMKETIAAINGGTTGVKATGLVMTDNSGNDQGRISLTGDVGKSLLLIGTPKEGGLIVEGAQGVHTTGGVLNTAIAFHETDTSSSVLATMQTVIQNAFPGAGNFVSYADLQRRCRPPTAIA